MLDHNVSLINDNHCQLAEVIASMESTMSPLTVTIHSTAIDLSSLKIGETFTLYTTVGDIDVFVTGIEIDRKEKKYVYKGAFVMGNDVFDVIITHVSYSNAYGPHFCLEPNFSHYLPMLNNGSLTWEEYTKIADVIYRYFSPD